MTRNKQTRRAQNIDLNGKLITRTVREVENETFCVEERNGELEYCSRDRGYTVADGWKYMVTRVRFFGEEEWGAWRPVMLDGEPVRFQRSRRRSIDEESARWIDRVVLHVADYEERIAFTATDLYRDVFNNCARWFVEKGAGKMPEALEPFTMWDDDDGFYKKRWVGLLHSSLMRLSKDRTPFEAVWDVRRGRDVRTFIRTSGRTQSTPTTPTPTNQQQTGQHETRAPSGASRQEEEMSSTDETYEMPQTHSRRDELKKELVAWMKRWVPYYIDDGIDYGVLTAEGMEVEVVDMSEGLGGSDSNPPYRAKAIASCPLVDDASRVAAVSVEFDWVKKEWWTTTFWAS